MPVPWLHHLERPVRAVVRALDSKYVSPPVATNVIGLSAGPAPFRPTDLQQTILDPTQDGFFPNFPGLAASIAATAGITASTACVAAGEADPDGDPFDNDCSGDSWNDPD